LWRKLYMSFKYGQYINHEKMYSSNFFFIFIFDKRKSRAISSAFVQF